MAELLVEAAGSIEPLEVAIYNELRHDKSLTLIALEGLENNRKVYTFNITYSELVEFFKPVPFNENSDLLLQRETQKSRKNNIFEYAKVDYAAFPACGAIFEAFTLEPTSIPNIVQLTLPAESFRYLFDGQGRLGGITKLLTENPEFSDNSIVIKAYETEGVIRDNQLFSDWNGATSKPNKSICQAMDSRTLINTFTKQILASESMSLINKRIDYTKASVTQSQSPKLWSLNQFNTVVQIILGVTSKSAEKLLADEEKRVFWSGFITAYFNKLIELPFLKSVVSTDDGVKKAKEETVIGTAVWLKGIAYTGKVIALHLLENTERGEKADWSFITHLDGLDYRKDNPEWIGRCLDFRGRFQDKAFNQKAIASYILKDSAIELPEEFELIEDEVLVVKSEQRKAERDAKKAEIEAKKQAELDLTQPDEQRAL
jgi:DGQHR domain-containing protein